MTVPSRGNASFQYTDHDGATQTVNLHWPIELAPRQEFRVGVNVRRYSRTSLDLTTTEVARIGDGVDEIIGRVRYHSDAAELKKFLRHAADGVPLTYTTGGTDYPCEAVLEDRSGLNPVTGDSDEWFTTNWEVATLRLRRVDGGSFDGLIPS